MTDARFLSYVLAQSYTQFDKASILCYDILNNLGRVIIMMKAFDKSFLAESEIGYPDFIEYLDSQGEYDYYTIPNDQLTKYFVAFQAEYYKEARLRTYTAEDYFSIKEIYRDPAYGTPYVMPELEKRSPLDIIAWASAAEHAKQHSNKDAFMGYSKAIINLAREGGDLYRALAIVERDRVLNKGSEDQQIQTDLAAVSTRLGQATSYSPYEEIFQGYEEVVTDKKKLAKLEMDPNATEAEIEALRTSIEAAEAELKTKMQGHDPAMLQQIAASKKALITTEQKIAQGYDMSQDDQPFVVTPSPEYLATTEFGKVAQNLAKEQEKAAAQSEE